MYENIGVSPLALGLNLTWSETPIIGFPATRLIDIFAILASFIGQICE